MSICSFLKRQYDPFAEVRANQLTIISKLEAIMATIADLQASVAKETDAENAVITLLQGISQQLKDAKASGDPKALDAVIASIDANTAKLGAAVVENTPAA